MTTNVSFGSMFNPERTGINNIFNPEHNLEGLSYEGERPKDFPAMPSDSIGRSQVVRTPQKFPKKLELSKDDKEFLSKLSMDMYGFHCGTNKFWVHSMKPSKGNFPNMIMGDGQLINNMSRHDFANKLITDETQAFQFAGKDEFGGNKLITVVKNSETDTLTMYTCDSKQCYPMVIDDDVDIKKLATSITNNLTSIQGITVWKE